MNRGTLLFILRQVIEVLVEAIPEESRSFEVNVMNKRGLSAMDLLLMFPSEAGDREIYEKLIEASEARSALLVVVSLVATATFQASLTPPGGTWQDSSIPAVSKNTTIGNTTNPHAHIAGESIMGNMDGVAFTLFVLFSTIGFSVSLSMLNILTHGFPLQLQLQICMMAMYFSHNTAMINIAPDHVNLYCVLITSIIPATTPALMRLLEKPIDMLSQFLGSRFKKFRSIIHDVFM